MQRIDPIANRYGKFVFLRRTDQVEPRLTIREFRRQQASEAAEQIAAPAVEYHGFTPTGVQELDDIRFGVREDLTANMERWLPNQPAGRQIMDYTINQRFRSVAAREISVERQEAGWFRKKFIAGRGFYRKIRSFFRGERHDDIGTRVREIFGEGQTIDQQRIDVAQRIWNGLLLPGQQAGVIAELGALHIPVPPPPPVPAGVNAQVVRLSIATPEQLEQLRRNAVVGGAAGGAPVFAAAPRPRFFPGTRPVPRAADLDRLIQLGGIQAEESVRRRSVTVHDPQKLQAFIDTIRTTNPDIYEMVLEKILDENELIDLENNPKAMALVADLEFMFRTRGQAALLRDLNDIHVDLPTYDEELKPEKEPSPEKRALEGVKKQCEELPKTHKELGELYDDARAVGSQWYSANGRLTAARNAAQAAAVAAGAGSGTINVDQSAVRAIEEELNKINAKANELQKKVRTLERAYTTDAAGICAAIAIQFGAGGLPAAPGGAALDPYANFRPFMTLFGPGGAGLIASTETQLFGDTDPAINPPPRPAHNPWGFETHITANTGTNFDADRLKSVLQEIKDNCYKRFKPRRKLKAEELHMFLERSQLFRAGNTNIPLATNRALLTVRRKQNDVRNLNLYTGTNQKAAEHLGGTLLGMRWLDRARKWLTTKIRPDSLLTAQHVIDAVSIDKEDKNLGAFFNMPPDITREEFRNLCDRKGITKDTIARLGLKLRKTMEENQMSNPDFNISSYDKHGKPLEDLVVTIQTVLEEPEQDEIIREVVAKGGNFEENVIEVMRAKAKARQESENKLLDEIAVKNPKWARWFKRAALKQDWGDDYANARRASKEMKMTAGQRQEYIAEENMAAIEDRLGTSYAVAEAAYAAKYGAKWSWRNIAAPTGRGLGNFLGWSNRRILQPTGRAALKVLTFPARLYRSIFKGKKIQKH